MNPAEWLVRTSKTAPEAQALLTGETLVATYREFARRAASIGGYLKAHYGVGKGDCVAVL